MDDATIHALALLTTTIAGTTVVARFGRSPHGIAARIERFVMGLLFALALYVALTLLLSLVTTPCTALGMQLSVPCLLAGLACSYIPRETLRYGTTMALCVTALALSLHQISLSCNRLACRYTAQPNTPMQGLSCLERAEARALWHSTFTRLYALIPTASERDGGRIR